MKKLFIMLLFLLTVGTINAQKFTREGDTFVSSSTGEHTKSTPIKTKFNWKDTKGNTYPVYVSSNGSCFVVKTSKKTGKEYKAYLGPEISAQICKELGITYKGKKGGK